MYPILSCKEAVTYPSGKPFSIDKVLKYGFINCAPALTEKRIKMIKNIFLIVPAIIL
jgi:hypothetical protein